MNWETVERIANAVLYEGYILYPYRPSSVKNRRRFNFGVLVPPSFASLQGGAESSSMRTECLVCGSALTTLDVRVRFLQVMPGSWQNAMERGVSFDNCRIGDLLGHERHQEILIPLSEGGAAFIEGSVTVTAQNLDDGLHRLAIHVLNQTHVSGADKLSRDEILPFSMASAHTILAARNGEFVSLLDPPDRFRDAVAQCENLGTWPVLAGDAGQHGWMLSSPIILYDYPQIAPESPGELFDGTEIDEILTLRIMTLTDAEKLEIRASDERARQILERTETLPAEQLMKLHGVLRGLRPVEDSK